MANKAGGLSKRQLKKLTAKIDNELDNLEYNLNKRIFFDLCTIQGTGGSNPGGKPIWNGSNACKWLKNSLQNLAHSKQLAEKIRNVNEELKRISKSVENK